MLTEYWRSDKLILNMGDYIAELLIKAYGYEVELHHVAKRKGNLDTYERCTLVIGTLFDSVWFKRIDLHKHIWGCGYWGDKHFAISLLDECTVHLVRGPLTRDQLGLPSQIPVGDPALLMKEFFPLEKRSEGGVVYVPHFNSRESLPSTTLRRLRADFFLDIACTRKEFWERVQKIVDANFVLTSSLHAAIVAQSYGRPWALVLPRGAKLDKPMKWQDWFASLDLDFKVCANLKDAENWWQCHGLYAKAPPLDRIKGSFPHLP